jgi:hypothetical protein
MVKEGGEMYTAGGIAEQLGLTPGAVKKLMEAQKIEPDDIKRGCKYYVEATLQKLRAAAKKQE